MYKASIAEAVSTNVKLLPLSRRNEESQATRPLAMDYVAT